MQKSDTNNTLPLIELPQITQQWNQQETPKSSEFDIAVSYLKKAPQKRSNNEQAHIFKVMMQISFFRDLRANYGIETAEICCSNLRYKNTQTGQVLFRQGDVGDAFYIIMRGCVSVQVQTVMRVSKQQQDIKSSCIQSAACSPNNKNTSSNNKNSQIHCSSQQEQYPQQQRSPLASPTNISAQQQQSSFASRVQSAMRRMQQSQQPEKQLSSYAQNINESPKEKRFTFVSSQQPLKDTVDDESDEIGEFENVVADKEVKELKTGDSFGELALLQTGKAALRAATILAKQFTHFAYLTATDFQNILRDKEEAKLNENVSFFSKVNLIQGLDDSELRLIFLYCSSRIVSCNEIVYSERDTPEFFYFVKSESSQVNPSSSISNNNNTNTLDNQITEHKIPQNHPSFRSYNRKIQNQPAPISLVSAGQCFGHLEIVRKYKKRRYSVKCVSSEGLLYLMTATDFMSKIMSNSKSNLRERVKSDVEHKSGLYEDNEKRGFDTRRNHFQFLFQSSSEYQYLSYDQVLKATQCDLKSNRPSILKPIQLLRQLSQDHGQVNSAGCQENEDEQTQFTRLKSHSTNYSYDKQQYQQRQSIFQQQKLQQMQRQSNLQSSPEQLYYPVRSCIPNDASNSNGFRSSFMYPSQQILAQDSLHLSTEQTNQNQADRNILGIDKDIQDGQQFNRHNNQSFGSPLVSTLLNNKTNNSLISRIKSITLSDKTSGSFISDPSKHSPQLNCLNLSGISQQQPFNHSSKESSFRNSNNLRLVKYKTEDSYCTNDQVFNCNNNSQIGSSICSPFLDPRKPEQFYERERQKLEEIKKAQHARAISDIHAKNLAEEQSHIQLQERADQILESINGYKCLKSKLNGIQQAISARGSQDGKVKKSIVFGEFFASVKALHDKKLAERKVKRYEFIDFRKFEEFMDENVYQIHRKLTNHRKSQDIKGKQMKGQQNSKESSQARSLSDNARNKLK